MIKIDGAIRGILRSLKKRQYIPFRGWFSGEAKEKAQCLSGLMRTTGSNRIWGYTGKGINDVQR
jgi:hypothetical protein